MLNFWNDARTNPSGNQNKTPSGEVLGPGSQTQQLGELGFGHKFLGSNLVL